jgi:glyoxylase-like metal-dependent hydrolase (beta-lactamase superfamily II)
MRLTERVYLLGSGSLGFDITAPTDCHVYGLDGGDEWVLVDCGAGLGTAQILEIGRRDGLDLQRMRHVLLTHKHGDHAGGAAMLRRACPWIRVHASPHTSAILHNGDEQGSGVEMGKRVGIYPADYRFEADLVEEEIVDGDVITVGDLSLEVISTPGHCEGHLSFLVEVDGSRLLFSGDAIFWGGTVMLQGVPDCSLQDSLATILRLEEIAIDVLLPGHLSLSLKDGHRHIQSAARVIRNGGIPRPAL